MSEKVLDYSGWYGVRCVFGFSGDKRGRYEERITLWRAQSFVHAHELATQEARRYAGECQVEFLEHSDAYWIDPELFELDNEVFSLLRESDLAPAEYVKTFYLTGKENGCGRRPLAGDGDDLEWYGVRCFFWWADWGSRAFEERVTLWHASSSDRAVELAEQEAREYVQDSGIEYLGLSQASNHGESGDIREGMVAFSLIRDSELSPVDYIAAFFNTGREHVSPDKDMRSDDGPGGLYQQG